MIKKDASYSSREKSTKKKFSILNVYVPNVRAHTFIKETSLKFKTLIEHHTIIVGVFNTRLSPIDRSLKQTKQRHSESKRGYE